jgi:hypothetical protein
MGRRSILALYPSYLWQFMAHWGGEALLGAPFEGAARGRVRTGLEETW